MSDEDIREAGRVIKALLGVSPAITTPRQMTRKERQEQAARVRQFLALPPELQEGALRYAENIKAAYAPSKI